MKNNIAFSVLSLCVILVLCSCTGNADTGQDALIAAVVSDAAKGEPDYPDMPASAVGSSSDDSGVDIDLTEMSSTMIYSVIYDIMISPDNYYGKSLIVDGYFDTAVNDLLGVQYYFVVVPDATACCAQGLEFKLDESKSYPDDYPEIKEDIRIKGVLDRYTEEGQTYSFIRVEELKSL